jgi:N6-adenosine-specific RNA methylase IME4
MDKFAYHPAADIFPMMSAEEFAGLKQDIEENGQLEPILIDIKTGSIIDGRNRYEACLELDIIPECQPWEGDDPVSFVMTCNLHRRHLSSSQKAVIALDAEKIYAEEAKKRQGARTDLTSLKEFKNVPPAVEQAAKATGTNMHYVSDAKRIQEVSPELLEEVRSGDKTIPEAMREVKKSENIAKKTEVIFPVGKYSCIVIDPPWPIEKIEREVRPNQHAPLDYPTMSIEEISALPIQDIVNTDGCHVYLWVTQKYLPIGLELLEKWGLRYQCTMTWVKPGGFTPFSWMYNTEHVLFARIGNLPLLRNGLKLSFEAPATGHSIKPDVFYQRVIEASPIPRIDMFARDTHEGFMPWGNEAPDGQ